MMEQYRTKILAAAEPGYREFTAKLLPGTSGIQGVRIPVLRKLAAEMRRSGEWSSWLAGYWDAAGRWFEEDMLAGFCIAEVKMEPARRMEMIRRFLPHVRNWSVCDSFCASLKDVAKNRAVYWTFIEECLQSGEEFTVRMGAVLLLDHYDVPEWQGQAVRALAAVRHPGYYAQMAQAWALAEFYLLDRGAVLPLLEGTGLPAPVRKMAVRKICESRRSTPEERAMLRALLKKGGEG